MGKGSQAARPAAGRLAGGAEACTSRSGRAGSVTGCVVLFFFLPWQSKLLFPVWSLIGLAFYYAYSYRHSHVGRGHPEVPEFDDTDHRQQWQFQTCRAQGSVDDEIFVAFG